MTSSEIIDALKEHWNIDRDAQLAEKLDVDRRSINQYRNTRTVKNIQKSIIINLLSDNKTKISG